MSDQADRLRQLVGARRAAATFGRGRRSGRGRVRDRRRAASHRTTRSLALYQRQGGRRDVEPGPEPGDRPGGDGPARAWSSTPTSGLANLDLLCGLTPRYDLGDVLAGRLPAVRCARDGARRDPDRPGGACHTDRCRGSGRGAGAAGRGARASSRPRPTSCWWTRARVSGRESAMLAAAADQAVIVSTPEPTSIADAHAAISRFRRLTVPPRLRVLVNQAGVGRRSRRRSRPAGRVEPPVPRCRGLAAGTGLGPGRSPRPAGGPRPAAILDRLSGRGRLARRATAGPRLVRERHPPARKPPRRLLRGPGRTMGTLARGHG